jgi:uncharacterized protein (TIGR02996 family)
MTTAALQRAAKSTDPKVQLEALLTAWRELRHPRLAELIDRVTARALDGQKRITAKSTPKVIEALVAALKTKDAVEIGRALASEWPKTWQALKDVIDALGTAPLDPRIAKRLATFVDQATPTFHSRGARSFWFPLFQVLNRTRDVRQLELLEKQLGRAKSRYYRDYAQPWEENAVKQHRAIDVPKLSKQDEALVVALEAPFAVAVSVEGKRARSGTELLEAVWANPTDAGTRAVYGDWLAEQADPRGELIALQLAAPSEKSGKRIRTLIDKHWKTWLGPLADWFSVPPHFELGFPVRGTVATPSGRDVLSRFKPLLARPEWSTFTQLTLPWDELLPPHELLALPRFKAVRALGQVLPEHVVELARAQPKLTRLELDTPEDEGFVLPRATWDSFEALERVVLWPQVADCVLAGLGKRALPTLELSVEGGHAEDVQDALWAKLDAAKVETVELRNYEGRVHVTRAKPGAPFTHVHFLDTQRMDRFLLVLPPGMTHLTCAPGPRIEARASAVEHLEKSLKRYKKLEVRELPIEQAAPQVEMHIEGCTLPDEVIPKLWELLRDRFAVTFGNVQIGWSGSATELGPEPREVLLKTARRRRDSWLYLDGAADESRVGLTRKSFEGRLPVRTPEQFFEALLVLLETFGGTEVSLGPERYDRQDFKVSTLTKKRAEVLALLRSLEA